MHCFRLYWDFKDNLQNIQSLEAFLFINTNSLKANQCSFIRLAKLCVWVERTWVSSVLQNNSSFWKNGYFNNHIFLFRNEFCSSTTSEYYVYTHFVNGSFMTVSIMCAYTGKLDRKGAKDRKWMKLDREINETRINEERIRGKR